MKYMFYCFLALVISNALGYILARYLNKKSGKEKKKSFMISVTCLSAILILVLASVIFFLTYSRAGEKADSALKGNDKVTVTEIDNGYYFDGPSETRACIFYPGARVEYTAYAPLMIKLAEKGFDCFLIRMPLNMALFGEERAESILSEYNYETWIMSGHSMGGLVASMFAEKHSDLIDGMAFLASYPYVKLPETMDVISIYGSKDGCLEMKQYSKNKQNFPSDYGETVIEGANHAQFGDYGKQNGDGEASISAEHQYEAAAQLITGWFKSTEK